MEEILEFVGTPVVICSSDGNVEWLSAKARETFGSLAPLRDWTVGPAESGRDAFEALTSEPDHGVEVWLDTSDGQTCPFIVWMRPAEQKLVLTLSRQSRVQADYPQDRAPDVFFRLGAEGRILFASGPCMGKPPEVITGRVFTELLPAKWGNPMRLLLKDLRTEPRVELSTSRIDYGGDIRVMVSRMLPVMVDDEVSEFVLQWWDITEEQSARNALKVTETQYRQVIENSLDLVGIFDAERYRLQFVSPNSGEFVGRAAEDVIGRSIFEFIDPRDHELTRQRIRNLADARTHDETFEVRTHHSSGKTLLLEARARLLATDGDERLVIMNARDITQRRESQLLRRSLMRADKLAAIGQVAASVAHEVNNPASFITTNLHVMRDEFEGLGRTLLNALDVISKVAPERLRDVSGHSDESPDHVLGEIRKMLDTNLEGMARIGHIVRELRSFSRTDDEDAREFLDLCETLRAACSMVRNQITYFAKLEEDFDGDLPLIYAERGKLNQVIVNLLVNASQAVQQADREKDHVIRLRAYEEGEGVIRVDVEDSGTGVKPAVAERIFDPFFTTKEQDDGTGLGLWLCHEIVEKCGGRLWLDETSAAGSRFSFTLPAQSLVEIPESPFEELSSSAQEDVERARVLVVDDDELVIDSYRRILETQHDVVAAIGGEDAVQILDTDQAFDVVVCDIIMPRVDGVDVYQHIERNHPELIDRIYFCTAGVFTDRTREFVAQVRDRVVHKPISGRQLKSLVAKVACSKPANE